MSRAVFNHRIFTLDQEITKLLTELLVYAESAQNMTPEYAEKGHGLITRIMVCRQERAALDALKHYLPPEVADEF